MYTVVFSKRFKKQYKKIINSGQFKIEKLETVIIILKNGETLPSVYRDHTLKGELQTYRECHIAPDWLLIYRIDKEVLLLELFATGSHSELF